MLARVPDRRDLVQLQLTKPPVPDRRDLVQVHVCPSFQIVEIWFRSMFAKAGPNFMNPNKTYQNPTAGIIKFTIKPMVFSLFSPDGHC